MKSYIALTAVILSVSAGALAQDGAIQPDAESTVASQPESGRVPIMVVPEAPDKPRVDVVLSAKAPLLPARASGKPLSRPLVMGGTAGSYNGDATTGNLDYDQLVLGSASRNGVDPALMVEVMRQESG